MAKQITRGKFLLIECTAGELMNAVGSDICICDWCGRPYLPSDKGVYIAVHNHWYCKECFYEWAAQATGIPKMPMLSVRISASMLLVSESNVSKC